MFKKTLILGAVGLLSLGSAVLVQAQETATIVLKNGERPSGELVDLGGVGFTLRVNGQDRQIPVSDVRAIEFQGGAPSAAVQQRINEGRSIVVLRSGEVIEGSLYDIGGTHPLRVTIDTPGGRRDFTSNDVAQIYYGGAGAVATTGQAAQAGVSGGITVPANQPWTDTGITVARGERIAFNGSGDINFAEGPGKSSGVGGSPLPAGGRLPVANAPLGALIGRVGNSAPFLIGANTGAIPMPANGRLMLGVNDDHYPDNNGDFTVTIQRLGR